jgi:hypothetical protein
MRHCEITPTVFTSRALVASDAFDADARVDEGGCVLVTNVTNEALDRVA